MRVGPSSIISTTTTIRVIWAIGTVRVVSVHIRLVPGKSTRHMARLLAVLGVLRVLMLWVAWKSLVLVVWVMRVWIARLAILAIWSHRR
jgi:hypothetical protein